MDIGMLWGDTDTARTLAEKIARAASYYQKKYGAVPTMCFAHPTMLDGTESRSGLRVLVDRTIQRHHLWLGVGVLLALLCVACGAETRSADSSLAVQGTRAANDVQRVHEYTIATVEYVRQRQSEIELQSAANAAESERQRLEREQVTQALAQAQAGYMLTQIAISQSVAAEMTPRAAMIAAEALEQTTRARTEAEQRAANAWAESEQERASATQWGWLIMLIVVVAIVAVLLAVAARWGLFQWREIGDTERINRARRNGTYQIAPNAVTLIPGQGTLLTWGDRLQSGATYFGTASVPPVQQNTDPITIHNRNGSSHTIERVLLSYEQRELLEFLEKCIALAGPESERIPASNAYCGRYRVSATTWQYHVDTLKPIYVEASMTGTRIISQQYPTLYAMAGAVRAGVVAPTLAAQPLLTPGV